MFDDLAAYFYENLAGSYMAYLNVRNNKPYGMSKDVRAGLNAATALYHAREHLPTQQRKTRRQVILECSDYGLLGDIVNVSKHGTINRNNPQITSAGQITEAIVSTTYEDEEGMYSDACKEVVVELDNGSRIYLIDALTEVVNYWGSEFVRLGILDRYSPFPPVSHSGNQFVNRNDVEGEDMGIEIMRGVRFQQTILFYRYNTQLKKAEPIPAKDIENVRFTIYKPSYPISVDLKLVSGKEYSLILESTEEEFEELRSLKTDEERKEFTNNFVRERAEEINQLLTEAIEYEGNEPVDNKEELKSTTVIASGKVESI